MSTTGDVLFPARICRASDEHVPGLAACHAAAFPGEFMTLLGDSFLRCFYRFYAREREGICLVWSDERTGRVAGLVAGGSPELRARFTRSHVARFLGTIAIQAVRHRRVRQRLGEHLTAFLLAVLRRCGLGRSAGHGHRPPEDPVGTWSNLLSICVHPEFRGLGVGKALMEAFRIESGRHGFKTMRLSVHSDNADAVGLYQASGWLPVLTTPKAIYFKRSVAAPSGNR